MGTETHRRVVGGAAAPLSSPVSMTCLQRAPTTVFQMDGRMDRIETKLKQILDADRAPQVRALVCACMC